MAAIDLKKLKFDPAPCNKEAEGRNWAKLNLLMSFINDMYESIEDNTENAEGDETEFDSTIGWAISQNDGTADTFIAPSAANDWRGQVKAIACDNSEGQNPDVGNTFWVILPGRENVQQDLPEGSVFSWALARSTFNGEEGYEPTIVSDYTKEHRVRWGKAQSDSTDHEVVVRECDDAAGANPVEPNLTVLLPHRAGYDHDVATDDVIAFIEAADGTLVCVTDYTLVEEIVRFQLTATLTPDGNATAELLEWGGISYDLTGSFITVYDWDSPGRWRGPSGYRGIAVRKKDSSRYEVIYLESIAELCVVTLTTDMSAGVSANATVNANWNGNDPGATIDVYDTTGVSMYGDLVTGDVVMVKYDWKNGRYRPIDIKATAAASGGFSALEFTAVGDMTAGVMSVNVDNSWGPVAPGADPINVEDRVGLFSRAKGPDGGIGRAGAKGIAVYDTTAAKWIVVECQTMAGWVRGKFTAAMSGTPKKATFQVQDYGGSQQDIQDPGTTIDVYGVEGLTDDLLTDDYSYALYSATDGRYYAVNSPTARWAKVQALPDVTSPASVSVKFCDDVLGANEVGLAFDAMLPAREGAPPYLPTSSVVLIDKAKDGEWCVVSDYSVASYFLEGVLVGNEPILDFRDTATINFDLTDVDDTVQVRAYNLYEYTHPVRDAGWIEFTLTADKSGTSATASVQRSGGTEDDTTAPVGTITVYDADTRFPLALNGAKGWAIHDRVNSQYRIVTCQQMTTMIRGVIPTSTCGLTTGDATFSVAVADIHAMDASPFNQKPAGTAGNLTIYNDGGWSAASGATFYAKWDHSATKWVLLQLLDARCEDPDGC